MHATRVEIDHRALRHNLNLIRQRVGSAEIMAVIKANAYGHGAGELAATYDNLGLRMFAVATVEEALELRRSGPQRDILLFGAHSLSLLSEAIQNNIIITLNDAGLIPELDKMARRLGKMVRCHINVDTGMGRAGVLPPYLEKVWELLDKNPGLKAEGLYTHFSSADEADSAYSLEQMERFRELCARPAAQRGLMLHMANSAAIMRYPQSYADCVRPGIMLYGNLPAPGFVTEWPLREAMQFKSYISLIKKMPPGRAISYNRRYYTERETLLALVPVGYADGYMRGLSGKARVLIGGKSRPVVGAVTMDQIVVELGPVSQVKTGDEVVLFGRQGDEFISISDVAAWAGTIAYEVTCAISRRVPRIHRF